MRLYTFEDALNASGSYSKRHLLLGNGFSIACRKDIFRYDALFEQADFSKLSAAARDSFTALGTTDFERVIKALRDAAILAEKYSVVPEGTKLMRQDADALKELLVETIASSHPEFPAAIDESEYSACQEFLSHFDTTYTFNYDLLLYWTQMHHEREADIRSDDGFRTSRADIDEGAESDYVVWEPGQSHEQNMWFLHGALHVFDAGTEVQKYTWRRTGIRLIQQIRDALSKDFFPLFVAEGASEEKYERIRHSDYLAKAYRSFESIQHCLFIFGHSLAENDEHYLRLIERGRLSHLFIGLFGSPESAVNQRIIARARAMQATRPRHRPLSVDYYDSASANVWGK